MREHDAADFNRPCCSPNRIGRPCPALLTRPLIHWPSVDTRPFALSRLGPTLSWDVLAKRHTAHCNQPPARAQRLTINQLSCAFFGALQIPERCKTAKCNQAIKSPAAAHAADFSRRW